MKIFNFLLSVFIVTGLSLSGTYLKNSSWQMFVAYLIGFMLIDVYAYIKYKVIKEK